MYYPNGTFTGYENTYGMGGNIPMTYMQQPGQIQTPLNQNALTQDEIQRLRSLHPSGMLDLRVSEDDVLRACCTHCDRGQSLVQQVNDGTGDLYCPLCGQRWQNLDATKEEVKELCDKLLSIMNSTKWTGDLPTQIVREYFTMMPLIAKFPDVYEYASKNMAKMLNQRGYFDAQNANIYAQYNSLFGAGYGPQTYPQQPMQQPYYQQPNMGYYQQPMQMAAPANPNVNPMQPMQQPYYQQPVMPQVNYGYNPQFQQQANMMVPPVAPTMPYTQPVQPVFQPATPQVAPVQQPVVPQTQPAAPQPQAAQPQQVVTTNKKIEL